jgi:hypothetical protein
LFDVLKAFFFKLVIPFLLELFILRCGGAQVGQPQGLELQLVWRLLRLPV